MDPPSTNPCDACDARCCRIYLVHLTGEDAWRIATFLDAPIESFAASLPQAVRSGTGFVLEKDGPAHDLVLGTSPGPDRRCSFLGEGGRCSIYRVRPRACSRFPARAEGGRVAAREGIACGPGAWSEAAMARRSWRAELEREVREIALHETVVAVWNERVLDGGDGASRTLADFLGYLGDAYGWLARFRRALRPRERSGAAFLERVGETLRDLPAR